MAVINPPTMNSGRTVDLARYYVRKVLISQNATSVNPNTNTTTTTPPPTIGWIYPRGK